MHPAPLSFYGARIAYEIVRSGQNRIWKVSACEGKGQTSCALQAEIVEIQPQMNYRGASSYRQEIRFLINLSTIYVSTTPEGEELSSTVKFMSLPDQVYDHLFKAIISGELKPGEKLVENELCKEFGTSRAPIRESFRILESEGLIVIQPRKGTYVKALTRGDIEEAFAVREALESLAAKLAVPHMTETEMNALANFIKEMDNSFDGSRNNFAVSSVRGLESLLGS